MTHFRDADLARWRESGPGDDADTRLIVAHVSECAECAARFAAMVREHSFDAPAITLPPAAREGRSRWMWVALPVAAAALIALAVPLMRGRQAAAPPALRGLVVHALTPSGDVGRDGQFSWSSGVAASRYRIDVSGPSGALYTMDASQSGVAFPGALVDRLQSGVEYSWSVTALDAEGRELTSSERRTFTLRTR